MSIGVVTALLLGILQGIFEWLPISSEGNLTVILSWLGSSPQAAVNLALFLHFGTAISSTLYYRQRIRALLETAVKWRPGAAFSSTHAPVTFLALATLVSGLVGIAAYALLEELISVLTGGAVIVVIGLLLILTGLFQRLSGESDFTGRRDPTVLDALLVGAAQGVAILPGISRSGSTTGVLLLRGYDEELSFEFSFLLSIPAAIGGGLLAVMDTGLGSVTPLEGIVALAAAAIVGYLSIHTLLRIVRRVSFVGVCVGLGTLAVVGGIAVAV